MARFRRLPLRPRPRLTASEVKRNYLELMLAEREGTNRSLAGLYANAVRFSQDPRLIGGLIDALLVILEETDSFLERRAAVAAGLPSSEGEQLVERVTYYSLAPSRRRRFV